VPTEATLLAAHARAKLALALASLSLTGALTGMWLVYDWLQNNHPHHGLLKVLAGAVMLSGVISFERADGAVRAAQTDDPYPTDTAAEVQKTAKLARRMALVAMASPAWCIGGLVLLVLVAGNVAR
jgi:hypothetical protein